MRVERLPSLLSKMLGAAAGKPRTLFTDRGPGFYNRRYGSVTGEYEGACRKHGFRLWAVLDSTEGPHAQPGDIADFLPHETVISWLRSRLVKSAAQLRRSWKETPAEFDTRLQADVADINASCDVLGACRSFPQRLRDLVEAKGDRLRK